MSLPYRNEVAVMCPLLISNIMFYFSSHESSSGMIQPLLSVGERQMILFTGAYSQAGNLRTKGNIE